jgi:hypothetical protein
MAFGQLLGYLGCSLLAWWNGRLFDWLVRMFVGWLVGQTVRRLVSRSVCWLLIVFVFVCIVFS